MTPEEKAEELLPCGMTPTCEEFRERYRTEADGFGPCIQCKARPTVAAALRESYEARDALAADLEATRKLYLEYVEKVQGLECNRDALAAALRRGGGNDEPGSS